MQIRTLSIVTCTFLIGLSALPAAAQTPSAEEVLTKMLDAYGGHEHFARLGILDLAISEEETRADGGTSNRKDHAYVSTIDLQHLRLESDRGLTTVRSGSSGWATLYGKLDDRPQTPRMARGNAHQRLFGLLLPFSLTMNEVHLSAPTAVVFEGTPAWRLRLELPSGFFATPAISRKWVIHVSRADHTLLAAGYMPAAEYTKVVKEGVQYRILQTQEVNGVILPAQVMVEGLNPEDGSLTGHYRVVSFKAAVRGWDTTLFLDPKKLAEIEEG